MTKILYISPENIVGLLSTWKKAHETVGNSCRYVTMFHTILDFPEDICLDLPLITNQNWYLKIRRKLQTRWYQRDPDVERPGNPPWWTPANKVEALYFKMRDRLWQRRIEKAIRLHGLEDFDIYHFEWGLDLYRDCRFAERLKRAGKHIVTHYHGIDLRNRGVLPKMDELSDLVLTNELDLLPRYPGMKYLFLPYDTEQFHQKESVNTPLRILHMTMNRYFKGTERIIEVCRQLEKDFNVEFILLERVPHDQAMAIKATCDINIDQISNTGGWGYGMNSVESLSMGICTCTNMLPEYEAFIPDHPFVNINSENLYEQLADLIRNPEKILKKGAEGKAWVRKTHGVNSVREKLYQYYREAGFIGD
ncbi:MAG: hypothetical protein J7K63_01250 [Candidatus Marinimicrobia bacterium]|nr:hypothetical protein [Candidatus Neomarinimicrobiota bacterium]